MHKLPQQSAVNSSAWAAGAAMRVNVDGSLKLCSAATAAHTRFPPARTLNARAGM